MVSLNTKSKQLYLDNERIWLKSKELYNNFIYKIKVKIFYFYFSNTHKKLKKS